MKHATIIPLIGGMTIGAENAFGIRPEFLISYSPFMNNDKHIINYYDNDVPYYLIDQNQQPDVKVDVVSSVCPCAGLSQMSHGFSDDNKNNEWMSLAAKYVLEEMQPEVYFGENAPGLSGKIGQNVRNNLLSIGQAAGYTMSIYRTKTLLHGGPQVRERTFYFFWKGDRVPILNWYKRDYAKIEDVISGAAGNFQTEPINKKTPSKDDPYYRFVLEKIHAGITHREFFDKRSPKGAGYSDVFSYIENMGYDYSQVAEWMRLNDYDREIEKCMYRYDKLKAGGNIMRRGTQVPKEYIGAFVGHYPLMLTHPYEDRYINYREAMTIMGLPSHFELVDASTQNVNHICQNVPVKTAEDMAHEVKAYLDGKRETVKADYVLQKNHSQSVHVENKNSQTVSDFFV